MAVHYELQSLRRLASRCRTHIKDRVVRLNIAEHRRHHANDLLPRDNTCILGLIHQLVNPFEPLVLPQQFLRKHHLEHKVLRIKRLAVHFQLAKINYLRLQHLLVLVVLLAHLDGGLISVGSLIFFFVVILSFLLLTCACLH